ncbi:hypothetical protein DSC45_07890 [Streptomyces sp. YIM 130001]|uniref:hypothetical protein n=1 Tax=Streptomyces sp. YIM 130001 TaxID=2259644 RepID=UPI000E656DC4|nr:hypothetical protein [Streptomyces sp. YIM 130001]RII19390.1 hypothetical protein DSC45_07890 [Streptomyces sp. YIM 130001]
MQNVKHPGRSARNRQQPAVEPQPEGVDPGEDGLDTYDTFEMYRVICPDCAQSIALLADEDALPEHAKCPTPWNPFGLTVCSGTGRPATQAAADGSEGIQGQDTATLLTLPQGLDWRTQPFSHVGGPGSRPVQAPQLRPAA